MPPKCSLRVHIIEEPIQSIRIPPCYMKEQNLFLPWFENPELLFKKFADSQNDELQKLLHLANTRTKQPVRLPARVPATRAPSSFDVIRPVRMPRHGSGAHPVSGLNKRRPRVALHRNNNPSSSSSSESDASHPKKMRRHAAPPPPPPVSATPLQRRPPLHHDVKTSFTPRMSHACSDVERDELIARLTAQLNTYTFLTRPLDIESISSERLLRMVRRNAHTAQTFYSSRTIKMTFICCLFLMQITLSVVLKIDVSGFWNFQRSLMPEYDMVCAEIADTWQPLSNVGPIQQLVQTTALYTGIYVLHDFLTRFGGANFLQALCAMVSINTTDAPTALTRAWTHAEQARRPAAADGTTQGPAPSRHNAPTDELVQTMPRPPPPLFPRQ